MQRIAAGFNRLAPFYNFLSKVVFSKTLQHAQEHFLTILKPNDRVLILGGGSGNFLQALLQHQPQVIIDYVDISGRMIGLAKTKNPSTVNFIVGTEDDIPDQLYGIVITNFYLDLFPDDKLALVIQKLKAHLNPDARWLVTDFVQERNWHTYMLWMMYRFFRTVTGIEAQELPDWRPALENAGMRLTQSKRFYRGFIKSAVYKRIA